MKHFFFFIGLLLFSCIEKIDIEIDDDEEAKIVFDGLLSNEASPYYFKLTKSASLSDDSNEGIADAFITISDESGVIDTLESLVANISGTDMSCYGLYRTTKIVGCEGETYHLFIQYANKTYEAMETMPFATHIDSLWVEKLKLETKDESVFCPLINFKNALNVENYYLFTYSSHFRKDPMQDLLESEWRVWPVSILDGKRLPIDVVSFNLNDGEAVKGSEENINFIFSERDSNFVYMYSISESCYLFYEQLLSQIRYDGGAFMPSPSSAKGNISNGALGQFRVNAVSSKGFLLRDYTF